MLDVLVVKARVYKCTQKKLNFSVMCFIVLNLETIVLEEQGLVFYTSYV